MAYKLVVADSSPSCQKAIQMAFPEQEFEIHPFRDGLELIKALSQISPDAILLNLSLPNRDGYEIGIYLKSQDELKQAPLILLKGAFEQLDEERISGLDYDEIVQEPFDSERLVRIIRDLIEKKKNPQTLPEELIMDEIPGEEHSAVPREVDSQGEALSSEKSLSSLPPEWKREIEEKIRESVRGEIVGVQRELEKRVRARILTELKKLIREELSKG